MTITRRRASALGAAAASFLLVAACGSNATTQAVTPNVLVVPTGGVSLDLLEGLVVSQLEASIPDIVGEVESEQITLPAGDALRMRYVLGLDPSGGSDIEIAVHQFLVVDDASGLYLTVSGPATDAFSAEALEIAESLELVD